MQWIQNDGKLVVCPECMRRNPFKEPVTKGQMFLCHNCRKRVQIRSIYGKLKPMVIENIYESTKPTKTGKKGRRIRGTPME